MEKEQLCVEVVEFLISQGLPSESPSEDSSCGEGISFEVLNKRVDLTKEVLASHYPSVLSRSLYPDLY